MATWLVFNSEGDYYALAQTDELRDIYLEELMIYDHKPGAVQRMPDRDPREVARNIAEFQAAYDRAEARRER